MILLHLIELALKLADEGHLDVAEVEQHKSTAERAEGRKALKESVLEHYVEAAAQALANVDGTPLALQQCREAHRLLVATRVEVRRLEEALAFVREAVEQQVAIGTHRKAAVALAEVRA